MTWYNQAILVLSYEYVIVQLFIIHIKNYTPFILQ